MFVLVKEEKSAALQDRVSWHLKNGYQLHGDTFFVERANGMARGVSWWVQALVRYEEIELRRNPSLNREGGKG